MFLVSKTATRKDALESARTGRSEYEVTLCLRGSEGMGNGLGGDLKKNIRKTFAENVKK